MGSGPPEPEVAATRLDRRGARVLLASRLRRGLRRLRVDAWPLLTAAFAAGAAYAVALYVVGHEFPVFAAIAAWVCLGFVADRRPRKVAELAVGVAVGVALGEVFWNLFGSGPVQVAAVLVLAVAIARLIDSAQMLAMQAGVQAVVVVALPPTLTGGGAGRWVDAVIGGAMALLVATLLPIDVRRKARALAAAGMIEVALTTAALARGIREGDQTTIDDALTRGRGSQGVIDEWRQVVHDAVAATRFTPSRLRHDDELARLDRACTLCDRAMRNTRVIARRAWSAAQDPEDARPLADIVARISTGANDIGFALGSHADLIGLRPQLLEVAGRLHPKEFHGWRAQTLVVLLRSLVVDLLELTGLTGSQAREALVELDPDGRRRADGSG